MKRTIKSIVKLMCFGFIGLALLSCSKNETAPVQEKAIGFNSYAGRSVSKADASLISGQTTLLDGSQFVVFAYNTLGNTWTGDASKAFMKDVTVTYEGEAPENPAKYTYSPQQYWPNDEAHNKLSFFAYYPAGGTGISKAQTNNTNGWGDYNFTAQTLPENMVDFCLSEVAKDQVYSITNSGQKGVVKMKFYHTLAQVKFQVKLDKDYSSTDAAANTVIKLKSIKLNTVKTTGTITPAVNPADNAPKATWGNLGGGSEFTVFSNNSGQTLTTTAVTVPSGTPEDDAYLMIPQNLGEGPEENENDEKNHYVVATIEYTVQTGTDASAMVTNTATVNLDCATIVKNNETINIKDWTMNQNIVYTFVIGLKPIQFIAEVTDWDPAQDVSFDVK